MRASFGPGTRGLRPWPQLRWRASIASMSIEVISVEASHRTAPPEQPHRCGRRVRARVRAADPPMPQGARGCAPPGAWRDRRARSDERQCPRDDKPVVWRTFRTRTADAVGGRGRRAAIRSTPPMRVLFRPALKGQDLRVLYHAVADVDSAADRFVRLPRRRTGGHGLEVWHQRFADLPSG